MRYPKWLVIITFIITMVSLIVLLVVSKIDDNSTTIYDISLAVFGSAMLGFIMSFIMYFTEKRRTLMQLYHAAQGILDELRKLRPLGPWDSESELRKLLEIYLHVSEVSTDSLRDAYCNLDFVFGKCNSLSQICANIFDSLYDAKRTLYNSFGYFRAFSEHQGMMEMAREKFNEFANDWFESEDEEEGDYISFAVYDKEYIRLANILEKLRCKIYRSKPIYIKRSMVQNGKYLKSLENND